MSDLPNENERHMFRIVAACHHKVWKHVCAKITQNAMCS